MAFISRRERLARHRLCRNEGDHIDFPDERPSVEDIRDCEDGARLLAGLMLHRNAADANDVPLRVFVLISMCFFAYGAFAGAVSTFFMYLLLLPLNSVRLVQMLSLVKKARLAAQGDQSMEWLKLQAAAAKDPQ